MKTLPMRSITIFKNLVTKNIKQDAKLRTSLEKGRHYYSTQSDYISESTDLSSAKLHVPVLCNEVLKILQPADGKIYVDMTFGAGGHTKEILNCAPSAQLYALDRDPYAFQLAKDLQKKTSSITPLNGKFTDLDNLFTGLKIEPGTIDGFLFDVGSSSMQFDSENRGFALSRDAPLDMRMDGHRVPDQITASDVVNHSSEDDLYQILKKYGDEKHARDIARAIIESRQAFGKIATTKQLASIVELVHHGKHKKDKLGRHSHAATKTFQALRIFVNDELNELNNGLLLAHKYLRPGGICLAIAFHSLEDRIVKKHFHGTMDDKLNKTMADHLRNSHLTYSKDTMTELSDKRWVPVSKKLTSPSADEIQKNPRSRSAKLRAATKC